MRLQALFQAPRFSLGSSASFRKRLGTLLVLVSVGVAVRLTWPSLFEPSNWTSFVEEKPILSAVIFVPLYATAVVALLPTLPLNLIAGALWGTIVGSVLALCGSVMGAIAAFLLARWLMGRPLGARFDADLIRRLQDQFSRHGWKVIAAVRLNPIFPGPVNYLFGLTSIEFRTFSWATTVFLAPPTICFAIIGDSVGSLIAHGYADELRTTLLLVGAACLVLTVSAVALGAWARTRLGPMSSDRVELGQR